MRWLLLTLAAAGAIAVPSVAVARLGDKPPLTAADLKKYEQKVQDALAKEREAINGVYKNTYDSHTEAFYKINESRTDLYGASYPIERTSFGGPSPVPDLEAARQADYRAGEDMSEAMAGKNFGKPFPKAVIKKIVAQLTIAIAAKKRALTSMSLLTLTTPPEPPTPPPAPTVGPFAACVITVNNGNTSNLNIKVVDPGGAGLPGTVNVTGMGLNQTNQIKLDSTGTAISQFTVGVFGTATIAATVTPVNSPPQTLSFQFTLNSDNDVTTTDCTPHQ